MKMKKIILLFFVSFASNIFAQKASNTKILTAINNFKAALSPDQLTKASFEYTNEERRNWFFIPTPRKGLALLDMTPPQKELAMQVLYASVSVSAAETAAAIMNMEITLKAIEKQPAENHRRHPEKFYFSIFGNPDKNQLWGWRIEGHHISINFDTENGEIHSGTPLFLGSNPAIVPAGYPNTGTQLLKKEEALGFDLLNSLNSSQKAKAIVGDKCPAEIYSSNTKHYTESNSLAKGISYNELDKTQKEKLLNLVKLYAGRYPYTFAEEFLAKIKEAGYNNLYFTWIGATEPKIGNGGHYYRIENGVMFVEYENTQNDANHVHTVIRDLSSDFGEDLLMNHYKKAH
jgi:hypothetical protein